jgi:hypothetical protein
MKELKVSIRFINVLLMPFVIFFFMSCDSSKKTIDKVTGNEAVKQFEKSKNEIDKEAEKQNRRITKVDEADEEEDDLEGLEGE